LGQGGLDQLVLEQRGGHVLEHRFAMGAGAVELAARLLVAHGCVPWSVNGGSLYVTVAIPALSADCGWSLVARPGRPAREPAVRRGGEALKASLRRLHRCRWSLARYCF